MTRIVCLTGGIGGAKLTRGFYRTLAADELCVAINPGDDFSHMGLEIWPDFDTTLYTLADLYDPIRGWGRADETWRFMETMGAIGGETWFQLGDRDLALHVRRTDALRLGQSPSDIARALTGAFGVAAQLLPASHEPVRTMIDTDEGELSFQDYFVRRRSAPKIRRVDYRGAPCATLPPELECALAAPSLEGVVIAPSNPVLSIGPMLAIDALTARLRTLACPVIAVSPIVAGQAIKGPTAKIMAELGHDVSALTIARQYAEIIHGFVIDESDAALRPEIEALGLACRVTRTVMHDDADKDGLARQCVAFIAKLGAASKQRTP